MSNKKTLPCPYNQYPYPPFSFEEQTSPVRLLREAAFYRRYPTLYALLRKLEKPLSPEDAFMLCYDALDCTRNAFAAILNHAPPLEEFLYDYTPAAFSDDYLPGGGIMEAAAYRNKDEILDLLLRRGASPNAQNPEDISPLEAAIQGRALFCVQRLLQEPERPIMKSQIIESVTIAQAKDTIAQAARIYFAKDQCGRYRIDRRRARPICLMGPAGIGKTEVVRQVAQEQGLAFLSYSITHHTRQSAIGLPRLTEGIVEGRTVSMTEYTMSEIIAQVYKTMADTGLDQGILFLDEYNCASESLRPIMLQLLQDKSFGPHPIPDGWMLVLAGNPSEYNRAASELDAVTADRMRLLHIQPDYAAWRAYAVQHNIHPVVLSYLDNHRDHFYVYRHDDGATALVTARGWEDLSLMMTYLEEERQTPDLALAAQYLQAGDVARSFFSYWTQYAAIIASGILEQVFARSPKALSELKTMSDPRAWSLVSALLRSAQTMAEQAVSLDATTAAVHKALKELSAQLEGGEPSGESLDTLLIARAEALEDRPARQFLSQCALQAGSAGEKGWESVKELFSTQLRTPRMEAFQRTGDAIANMIAVCRRALAGKPYLEFLFNRLADSREMMQVISCSARTEFRELFQDTMFDPASAVRELEAELNLSGCRAKKEAV